MIAERLVPFDPLVESIIKLNQLTHLTLVGRGVFELMDGNRWEQIISRTSIIKFDFKFNFNLSTDIIRSVNEISLLEAFRSPFWLRQKRWFVVCFKEVFNTSLCIYSIPRFRPHHVFLQHSDKYPPLSTALVGIEQRSFYTSKIDLVVKFSEFLTAPVQPFSQVNSLRLLGPELPPVRTLVSFVDLGRIKKLDISRIRFISNDRLQVVLDHAPSLIHLTMKNFDPLLIIPRHIRSFKLETDDERIDVDAFCLRFQHIEHLDLTVNSKQIMIQLIDQLEYLQSINFRLSNVRNRTNFSTGWFQLNSRRLNAINFRCEIDIGSINLVINEK